MNKSFEAESSEEISLENDSDGQDDLAVKNKTDVKSTREAGNPNENLASDESDAPVGVSWKDSKAVFQQDERNRNNAVNFARSVNKEKRRKKNEMFVSQKQAKRKYQLTKLPDDILQTVVKKRRQVEVNNIEKRSNKILEKAKKSKRSKRERKETSCHVVILEKFNKSKKVQESAAEFLNNHFYGNRLERTSGSTQLTMQYKSSGVVKPAVKFKATV